MVAPSRPIGLQALVFVWVWPVVAAAAILMSWLLQSAGASPSKARKVDSNAKVQAMVLEICFDVNVEAKGLLFEGGIVGALADADEIVSRPDSKNAVRWLSGLISKTPENVPQWAASFHEGLPQNIVAEYMSPSHPDNPTGAAQETAEGTIAHVPGAWCFGIYTRTFEEFSTVLHQLVCEAMGVKSPARPGSFVPQGGSSKLLFRQNASSSSRWTSWHSVQLRPVGLVPVQYVQGILLCLQRYPFLAPSGTLCACADESFRATFPHSVTPADLPGVIAKVKAREDFLIAQQSGVCPVGWDAGQSPGAAEKRVPHQPSSTAMTSPASIEGTSESCLRDILPHIVEAADKPGVLRSRDIFPPLFETAALPGVIVPQVIEPDDLPGEIAQFKTGEGFLIAQQSGVCPVGSGAVQSPGQSEKRVPFQPTSTAMTSPASIDGTAEPCIRAMFPNSVAPAHLPGMMAAMFPYLLASADLPAVIAQLKTREDSLIARQCGVCPVDWGAVLSVVAADKRVSHQPTSTAITSSASIEGTAVPSSRAVEFPCVKVLLTEARTLCSDTQKTAMDSCDSELFLQASARSAEILSLIERAGEFAVASAMRAGPASFEPESHWNEWLNDAALWVEESTQAAAQAVLTRESVCAEFEVAVAAMGHKLRMHMEEQNLESVRGTGVNYKILQKQLVALKSKLAVSPESLHTSLQELRTQIAHQEEVQPAQQPPMAWEFSPLI